MCSENKNKDDEFVEDQNLVNKKNKLSIIQIKQIVKEENKRYKLEADIKIQREFKKNLVAFISIFGIFASFIVFFMSSYIVSKNINVNSQSIILFILAIVIYIVSTGVFLFILFYKSKKN